MSKYVSGCCVCEKCCLRLYVRVCWVCVCVGVYVCVQKPFSHLLCLMQISTLIKSIVTRWDFLLCFEEDPKVYTGYETHEINTNIQAKKGTHVHSYL